MFVMKGKKMSDTKKSKSKSWKKLIVGAGLFATAFVSGMFGVKNVAKSANQSGAGYDEAREPERAVEVTTYEYKDVPFTEEVSTNRAALTVVSKCKGLDVGYQRYLLNGNDLSFETMDKYQMGQYRNLMLGCEQYFGDMVKALKESKGDFSLQSFKEMCKRVKNQWNDKSPFKDKIVGGEAAYTIWEGVSSSVMPGIIQRMENGIKVGVMTQSDCLQYVEKYQKYCNVSAQFLNALLPNVGTDHLFQDVGDLGRQMGMSQRDTERFIMNRFLRRQKVNPRRLRVHQSSSDHPITIKMQEFSKDGKKGAKKPISITGKGPRTNSSIKQANRRAIRRAGGVNGGPGRY